MPNWLLPERVSAISTKRQGGFSLGAYNSFNLGAHVNDDIDLVKQNRQRLVDDFALQYSPVWLNQVHGSAVVEIKKPTKGKLVTEEEFNDIGKEAMGNFKRKISN